MYVDDILHPYRRVGTIVTINAKVNVELINPPSVPAGEGWNGKPIQAFFCNPGPGSRLIVRGYQDNRYPRQVLVVYEQGDNSFGTCPNRAVGYVNENVFQNPRNKIEESPIH